MEVSYGDSAIDIPDHAIQTEITTYMWPGFLGEFDHSTELFDVWELVGPTTWKPRPDVMAPPYSCLGQESQMVWRWLGEKESRWMCLCSATVWRRIG
jgi:hypothetical protein